MNELDEKSEFELIMKDYNNNYGYNLGTNFITSNKANKNSLVKAILNVKKR